MLIRFNLFLLSFSLLFIQIHTSQSPSGNITDPCLLFLQDLTNISIPLENRSLEANHTLVYSGHNINDLGNFRKCNDKSTQSYSVVSLTVEGLSGSFGFCAPAYCPTDHLQAYSDNITHFISKQTGVDVSKFGSVAYIDPTITGVTKGFWFYFTIGLLSTLAFLVVAGTISANAEFKPKKAPEIILVEDSKLSIKECLLVNRDSTNDTFSKNTANTYLSPDTSSQKLPPVEPKAKELARTKPMFLQIIECFDLNKNIKDLFKNEIGPGHDPNLNIVNGIRAIAFGWVVYGHCFLLVLGAKNYAFVTMYLKSAWFLILLAAFYAVDTFFFLGGFFTGYFMLLKLKKMKLGLASYFMLFFHRWIRLWPAYFVAILVYWKISVHMGDGVLWYKYVGMAQVCETDAWKNWLFLDNVLTVNDSCFVWGWYLSNDFQMFLLAPFICWIYFKNRERSFNIIFILILISTMCAYSFSSNSGMYYMLQLFTGGGNPAENMAKYNEYLANYYYNPLVRMSPYLLGLYLGFLYKEYKAGQKNFFSWIQESNSRSMICATLGFATLVFTTFYPRTLQTGDHWTSGFAMTWNVAGRTLFAIGIFLLITPGLVGNLPTLSAFLSNYYFTLISRVSYSGYLIHLALLLFVFYNSDQIAGVSQMYESMIAFSVAVLSCFVAAIFYLVVEKPIVNLEGKLLHKKKPAKAVENKKSPENNENKGVLVKVK